MWEDNEETGIKGEEHIMEVETTISNGSFTRTQTKQSQSEMWKLVCTNQTRCHDPIMESQCQRLVSNPMEGEGDSHTGTDQESDEVL